MANVFGLAQVATDKIFLEFIMPGLNVEIRANTILYDRFKTDTEHVVGKYALFKRVTGSPKSARPSSSSTFPTAKQGAYDEYLVYLKRGMYAQLQFDGLTLACSQGKGAIADVLRTEVDGIKMHISNKLNRQYHGDGSGRLARCYGAGSNSTDLTIDHEFFGLDSNGRSNPAQYLDEGMSVDIYDSSGNLEAEDVDISAIVNNGDGTAAVTLLTAQTWSDNGYLFDHDTYAASQAAGTGVPMGLHGIISASNPYVGITPTYFQNIDRAASGKSWSKATIVAMGSSATAPTDDKLLELVQECEKWGRTKVLLTNAYIWRALFSIWKTDRTMPNEKAAWAGVTGLKFYGGRSGEIPVIYDDDCPDQRILALDEAYLKNEAPSKNGMAWLPGDSGILQRIQGKDESVASLVFYYNFVAEKTRAQGALTYVKHAAS